MLKVDESEKQTRAIIQNQHELDRLRKAEAEDELSNMVRVLKSVDVINPFAQKIALPDSAKMLRRLNKQFLDFVNTTIRRFAGEIKGVPRYKTFSRTGISKIVVLLSRKPKNVDGQS